jgi:hypothetical protein
MAKSTKALLMGRIQMCKTNPSIAHRACNTRPVHTDRFYASEPFSRLFERAWAVFSSTRRAALQIPTFACSTRAAKTPISPAALAVVVADGGRPDGCYRRYRRRGSTMW